MSNDRQIADAQQFFSTLIPATATAALLLDTSGPGAATMAGKGPAIYLCDVDTGRTLVLCSAAGAMERLSEVAALDAHGFAQMKIAFHVLVAHLLECVAQAQAIPALTRQGVILGALLCITETRGFHITKHHGDNVQHLLLRYADASTGNPVLTPMPLFKAHPVEVAELNATATHVLLSENLNYPQRFAAGKPRSFVETRRNVLAGLPRP